PSIDVSCHTGRTRQPLHHAGNHVYLFDPTSDVDERYAIYTSDRRRRKTAFQMGPPGDLCFDHERVGADGDQDILPAGMQLKHGPDEYDYERGANAEVGARSIDDKQVDPGFRNDDDIKVAIAP